MFRCVLAVASILIIAEFGRAADAVIGGVNFLPMSAWWEWQNPPLNGRVQRIVETTQVPSRDTGQLATSFQCEYRFTYQDGRVRTEINAYVGKDDPLYTITYDAQGRRTRLVWGATEYQTHQRVTTTESMHYDAKGTLVGLSVDRSDGDKIEVPVQTDTAADGGRTISWNYTRPNRDEHYTLDYDKSGRLTHALSEINGRKMVDGPTLTYNDHGDVTLSELLSGNSYNGYAYEYEYDAQGNWTRRSEYDLTKDQGVPAKKLRQVLERQIMYAGSDHKLPSSRPAVAQGAGAGKVVGMYKTQLGDPNKSGFYSIMLLNLKADGTMSVTNTMPDSTNPGQKIENQSEGKWNLSGDMVMVTLEKGNGKSISDDDPQKSLKLTIADGGNRLTMTDGPEFKRQR